MAQVHTPEGMFARDADVVRAVHGRMQALAQQFRLPFRRHTWRGQAGNWLGVGAGSSIDFQDHRAYLPGDDPRYIDWHAFARTGQYIMKLYREEVSPRVDVVLDGSGSMALNETKWTRSLELLYFAVESALQTQASLRCFVVNGGAWRTMPVPALLGHRLRGDDEADEAGTAALPRLDQLPLRHGSLRVWISDLLYPGQPETPLRILRRAKGQAVCFAPFSIEEENPPWEGNVELVDCEEGGARRQRIEDAVLRRYRDAYRRHFDLWQDQARRLDVPLLRTSDEGTLGDAFQGEGLRSGTVETWMG